jgi:hypothetical protein
MSSHKNFKKTKIQKALVLKNNFYKNTGNYYFILKVGKIQYNCSKWLFIFKVKGPKLYHVKVSRFCLLTVIYLGFKYPVVN